MARYTKLGSLMPLLSSARGGDTWFRYRHGLDGRRPRVSGRVTAEQLHRLPHDGNGDHEEGEVDCTARALEHGESVGMGAPF